MKFSLILLAFTIMFICVSCTQNKHGISVCISEDTIGRVEKQFLPGVFQVIQKTKIQDIVYPVKVKGVTTTIKVQKIEFDIGKITPANIKVALQGNNMVTAIVENITCSGTFDVSATTVGIPVWSTITVNIKDFDLNVPFKLGRKAQKSSGKQVAHAIVNKEDFKIHAEVEIKLNNAVLNWLKSFFDDYIKNMIKQKVDVELKDILVPMIQAQVDKFTETMPSVYTLKDTIEMHYDLISDPYVTTGLICLSVDGRIVNHGDENSLHKDFPAEIQSLPPMTSAPKGMKLQISTYTLNTALYALYYKSWLIHEQESPKLLELMPKPTGFAATLGIHPMSIFRKALIAFAGPDPTVMISVTANKLPQISLINKVFRSSFSILLSLSLKSWDKKTNTYGKYEIFTGWALDLTTSAEGFMAEGGAVNFKLGDLKLDKVETRHNKFAGEDTIMKWILNWGLEKAKTTVNQQYLQGVKYKPPTISGCSLNDSTVKINNDNIEVELKVDFVQKSKKLRRNKRRRNKRRLHKKY